MARIPKPGSPSSQEPVTPAVPRRAAPKITQPPMLPEPDHEPEIAAQRKFREYREGVEQDAAKERAAVADWIRAGSKGLGPATPAIHQLMERNGHADG